MGFLKDRRTAIFIAAAVVILSSLYGISRRFDGAGPRTGAASVERIDPQPAALNESYERGKDYYDSGDFERAIQELQKVPEHDSSFSEAQALLSSAAAGYRTEILTTADGYAAQQDYSLAISITSSALSILPEDAELSGAIKKYKTAIRTEAIAAAELSAAEQNYAEAISEIEGALAASEDDIELNALYDRYVSEYKSFLISKADEVYHTTGYEDAVMLLKQGIQTFGSDEELSELISQYELCVPFSFYSLTAEKNGCYYDGDSQGHYSFKDSVYDTEKNQRHNVIYCLDEKGNATRLYVDRTYKRISGTLFFRLDRFDDKFHKAAVSIYGDGELLYEGSVSNTDPAQYFEVDISDVIFLDVWIYTGFNSLTGNTALFGGISELNLFKNIM